MKLKIFQVLCLSFIVSASWGQVSTISSVEVISSVFTIHGKTNINSFECQLAQNETDDNLIVKSTAEGRSLSFEGMKLHYLIKDFECGIEGMNKDLRNTLKGDQHPCLFLQIDNITIDKDSNEIDNLRVESNVTITLAGVEREVMIEDGYVLNHSEGSLTLFGRKKLQMTDFDIQPPSKFFGIIQVTNDLDVTFEIRMNTKRIK